MAVFLLMGCQTTNTTPNAVVEPAPQKTQVEEKPEKTLPEDELVETKKALQTMKPILCADIESVHKGLTENSGENPILIWTDQQNGYMSSLWINEEKKTVSLIEYAGPGVGCFSAVGVNASWKEGYRKNIGTKTQYRP